MTTAQAIGIEWCLILIAVCAAVAGVDSWRRRRQANRRVRRHPWNVDIGFKASAPYASENWK